MRCPRLEELPAPPPGRVGWPWTEASGAVGERIGDGRPWSRVSIVTPSYNQGQFIEETIRSVLLQGYPDLEYIIIDGGSTDGGVEVIKKYEPWLAYWASEPDRGQAHAINKGFQRATGEILAWLNSDDTYQPGALAAVAQTFEEHADVAVVFGECQFIDEKGAIIWAPPPTPGRRQLTLNDWITWWKEYPAGQPAIFLQSATLRMAGPLNEALDCAFDYDLWLRVAENHRFHPIPRIIANFRRHPAAKSSRLSDLILEELEIASRPYLRRRGWFWYCRYRFSEWVWRYSVQEASTAVEVSRRSRREAAVKLFMAVIRWPFAVFLRPRSFAAALFRILFGWDSRAEFAKRLLTRR